MAPLPPKRVRKSKKKKNSTLLIVVIAMTTAVLGCGGIVTLMLAPHIAKRRQNVQRDEETRRSLADSPNLPVWTADPTLLERLDPEVPLRGYFIRLPTAFKPVYPGRQRPPISSMPGGATEQVWTWVGPQLPSGRHAVIAVEVRWPPPGPDARKHFESEFPVELRAMQKLDKVSEVVAGHVAGKRAIRVAYATAKGPSDCIALFYFELHSQVVVTVICPSADRSEVLPLLQAAQLTLRAAGEPTVAPPPLHAEQVVKTPRAADASAPASRPSLTEPIVDAPPAIGGDSKLFGHLLGRAPTFRDEAPEGGMLVGLELGTKPAFGGQVITSVRPLFRTVDGQETSGMEHGTDRGNLLVAKAKEGYAVAGWIVKAGLVVDGLSIVFMRVKGDRLDVSDSYESEWLGGQGGGAPTRVGCDGTLVTGVIGGLSNDQCVALGLQFREH